MKFLKKYKWQIAWLALWGMTIFYFLPRQNHFYLDSDKDSISRIARRLLLLLAVGLFILITIWAFLKVEYNGKVRQPWMILQSAFVSAIPLAVFYMFLTDPVVAAGLYINRQASHGIVQRSYVAWYFNGDEGSERNLFLYDIGSKSYYRNDILTRSAYRTGVHGGDTLEIDFKKGLFGVAYIDSLAFRKDHRTKPLKQ